MAVSLQKIYDRTRKLTNTNSTTLSNADLLLLSNETYLDILRTLSNNSIEVTGIVAHTNLVADQENYSLPDDCLDIVRVEINYDDPTDDNKWRKVTEVDLPNLPRVWRDFVINNSSSDPRFDMYGGQFYIAPPSTTNQTSGLRLWYIKKNTDFVGTDPSTENLPYPLHFYWDTFAIGNAYRYYQPNNLERAAGFKTLYEQYLKQMVDDLSNPNLEPIKTEVTDKFNHGWI